MKNLLTLMFLLFSLYVNAQTHDLNFYLKQASYMHSQFLNSYKLDSLNIAADEILFEQNTNPN